MDKAQLEAMLKAFSAQISQEASEGVMTLGELIARLEAMPSDADVVLSYNGMPPSSFGSYRGYYNMLAIDSGKQSISASEFLKMARNADGETFEGYKGGDYTMSRNTPVWASDWGDVTNQAITGVELREGSVFILSEKRD